LISVLCAALTAAITLPRLVPILRTAVIGLAAASFLAGTPSGLLGQEPRSTLQFGDLPHLDWAEAFDFDGVLEWGMSPGEVQGVLGVRFEPYDSWTRQTDYMVRLSATFRRQRIDLGTGCLGGPVLSFWGNRLYNINLSSHDGFEDGVLRALLETFGPARLGMPRLYHQADGDLVQAPVAQTLPRALAPRQRPEGPHEYEYEWLDNETLVSASDGYGYNNATRRYERCVSVTLSGWRVARAASQYAEPYENLARDFLNWLNSWRSRQ